MTPARTVEEIAAELAAMPPHGQLMAAAQLVQSGDPRLVRIGWHCAERAVARHRDPWTDLPESGGPSPNRTFGGAS